MRARLRGYLYFLCTGRRLTDCGWPRMRERDRQRFYEEPVEAEKWSKPLAD